ncbi:hypothetical protein PsorP6_015443 [Peronosclerospora sorghi]|uniref:Uncharacterized protein n=1 Tax=Peronosclerospora sorghi TaxID=230839 RepID=A0ACC0WR80_9STRA|nr:hypothetical protein PsorP6_015443 [Peronosclerospora sorghi]
MLRSVRVAAYPHLDVRASQDVQPLLHAFFKEVGVCTVVTIDNVPSRIGLFYLLCELSTRIVGPFRKFGHAGIIHGRVAATAELIASGNVIAIPSVIRVAIALATNEVSSMNVDVIRVDSKNGNAHARRRVFNLIDVKVICHDPSIILCHLKKNLFVPLNLPSHAPSELFFINIASNEGASPQFHNLRGKHWWRNASCVVSLISFRLDVRPTANELQSVLNNFMQHMRLVFCGKRIEKIAGP